MKVKELIETLQQFDPEFEVVGYCDRSEDDFNIENVFVDETDEYGLTLVNNQGMSVMQGYPGMKVVVIS